MIFIQPSRHLYQQWKMLLIYNIYRLMSILVLCLFFGLSSSFSPIKSVYSYFMLIVLILYFVFGLLCFYFWFNRTFLFERQVLWCGTIDVLFIGMSIDYIGHLELGLGIILYVTIAVLSIITPGRIAIFFASIASLLLLALSGLHYAYDSEHEILPFYTAGIYGVGFLGTALVTYYLASKVRTSEVIAERSAHELMSILRIGEYFIEQFKDGVIYVESDGTVRLINHAVRRYFNIQKKFSPCSIEKLLPSISPKYFEFISKQKRKSQYAQTFLPDLNVRLDFFSIAIDSKTSVLIIVEDMASVEQQAQQFKLASLGRLSASIAHELRNPLGIISHAVQLMGEDTPLDSENMRLKELILNSCTRMNQIIKNVLQLARQQTSKVEAIPLSPFLKRFKDVFTLINQCDISISMNNMKRASVQFDKSQLEQVLVILCDNAIRHGAEPDGSVHILISVDNGSQGVRLNLSDTGPGIPDSNREFIFEPFFTTLMSGNGMGLYIAKDLCEMNGARLIFNPTVKKGACFSILFNHHHEMIL